MVAEKAAWKIAEEHDLHLVTINPVFVIGPVLSARTDATSVNMIKVGSGPQPGTSLLLRPAICTRCPTLTSPRGCP